MDKPKQSVAIVLSESTDLTLPFSKALEAVRDDIDITENPYLSEAVRVLSVGGYRSAIGGVWNAVVDDLRNKIIHRSVELFNKAVRPSRDVQTYEDFQNYINDDQLIEGAHKIGVIGWEASKMLKQAKETRHVFDGHPKSSQPSLVKVLAMIDDCVKYVLSQPFPPKIIDIDEYLAQMATPDYDRNAIAIETALSELPEVYKIELANRLFTAYINPGSSSILRSNIEFASPILWSVLPKETKFQIVRRLDQELTGGSVDKTALAFEFVNTVGGQRFLSPPARKYKLAPIVERLKTNLDKWNIEDSCVRQLEPYAAFVPDGLLEDYVRALVMTYVGYTGGSANYSRTDFYANGAALHIPRMFQAFDDKAGAAFVKAFKGNTLLRSRITNPEKLNRLRSLGNIVLEKVSAKFADRAFLEALVDPASEKKFISLLNKLS
ncbi:MAG TPA: hypothetical protein VGR84_15290 [Candidatus Acidoferrales bacterium]|nr:hypothetical protein [Candidatus Acidoferrales bacterium]